MQIRAVFVDAAGTLMRLREPVGITYARFARQYPQNGQHGGQEIGPVEVEARFRAAMRARRARGERQEGDGRAFWGPVVAESVGSDDPALFAAIYAWYATPRAWWIDTEALQVLGGLARQGVRLGILSNWDTRLRTLYLRFALDRMFPLLLCSGELEMEKPDPEIFLAACRAAGCRAREAVHIGDDPVCDVEGARGAGMIGLQYDEDAGWRRIGEQIASLRRLPWLVG